MADAFPKMASKIFKSCSRPNFRHFLKLFLAGNHQFSRLKLTKFREQNGGYSLQNGGGPFKKFLQPKTTRFSSNFHLKMRLLCRRNFLSFVHKMAESYTKWRTKILVMKTLRKCSKKTQETVFRVWNPKFLKPHKQNGGHFSQNGA